MTRESQFPSAETTQYLLANLRRSRLEMRETHLQLEEVIAGLEHEIRQQKRYRLQKSRLLHNQAE